MITYEWRPLVSCFGIHVDAGKTPQDMKKVKNKIMVLLLLKVPRCASTKRKRPTKQDMMMMMMMRKRRRTSRRKERGHKRGAG